MRSPTALTLFRIKENIYCLHLKSFLTESYLELDRATVNTVIKPLRATINLNYISGPEKQKGLSLILSYLRKYVIFLRISSALECRFFQVQILSHCSFGGLGVACWPLVPKFAGSNPAEAVGFLRAKKSSARLPSEGK